MMQNKSRYVSQRQSTRKMQFKAICHTLYPGQNSSVTQVGQAINIEISADYILPCPMSRIGCYIEGGCALEFYAPDIFPFCLLLCFLFLHVVSVVVVM